jgi:hypothetical protein
LNQFEQFRDWLSKACGLYPNFTPAPDIAQTYWQYLNGELGLNLAAIRRAVIAATRESQEFFPSASLIAKHAQSGANKPPAPTPAPPTRQLTQGKGRPVEQAGMVHGGPAADEINALSRKHNAGAMTATEYADAMRQIIRRRLGVVG